jgi:hypothetical protein
MSDPPILKQTHTMTATITRLSLSPQGKYRQAKSCCGRTAWHNHIEALIKKLLQFHICKHSPKRSNHQLTQKAPLLPLQSLLQNHICRHPPRRSNHQLFTLSPLLPFQRHIFRHPLRLQRDAGVVCVSIHAPT